MSDHGNNQKKDASAGGGGGDHAAEHGHKKKHHHHGHGDHPEHEEGWIVSFADNVLLMMGFFVILLAMNMGPKAEEAPKAGNGGASDRMIDFAIGVREAFNNPVNLDSTDPNDAPLIKRMLQRQNRGESSDPGPDGDQKNVQAPRPSDYVNIAGFVTFADQSAELSVDAEHTLESVAAQVRGHSFMIEVRGHVSAQEARQDKQRAMRLAYDRAFAAADGLAHKGVSWSVMRVVACGDNERATPRASGEEHKNNQRVEVVITQEQKPPDPFASVETGP